jgi:putative transposase
MKHSVHHVHFIWQIPKGFTKEAVQRDFLKFTAQQIKDDLEKNHPKVMLLFKVNAKDRKYQKWERNSLSVDLFSAKVFSQKLNYIYQNPVKAGLSKFPEE